MKTKWIVFGITLVFALAMVAQTASQAAPAAPAAGDKASACPCCAHNMANMKSGDKCPMMKDGKMAKGASCCGKDGGCCKDGKCDMKAMKDGKMACCADGKCPMMSKDGKAGCCGDKCPMMKKGDKSSAVKSCCSEGANLLQGGSIVLWRREEGRLILPIAKGSVGARRKPCPVFRSGHIGERVRVYDKSPLPLVHRIRREMYVPTTGADAFHDSGHRDDSARDGCAT